VLVKKKFMTRGFLKFFPNGSEFSSQFYMPVALYLRQNTKFYSIISKFDKVMPYLAQPPSEVSPFTMHLA